MLDKSERKLAKYSNGPYEWYQVTAQVAAIFTLNDNACVIGGTGTLNDPFVLGDKNNLGE